MEIVLSPWYRVTLCTKGRVDGKCVYKRAGTWYPRVQKGGYMITTLTKLRVHGTHVYKRVGT